MQRVPSRWRPAIGDLLKHAPRAIDHAFSWAFPHDESSGIHGLRPAQKLTKLGRVIGSHDVEALYWRLLAPWGEPQLLRRAPAGSPFPRDGEEYPLTTIEENFMLRDLVGYLPDGILAKVDRAAMSVGLETRAPLLDHRIVEFAIETPSSMKFRNGVGKWLLRQVLYRHIPKKLVDRPKMGFGIPIASWLRGPLKPWAYDLVASSRNDAAHLLDLQALRSLLDRHSSGVGDWHLPIWTALMFLNWSQAMESSRESKSIVDAGVSRVAIVRSA
jgi:asparagine synthase (glutamine-hydrolysing)